MIMPQWITQSGLLANIDKGESFQYALQCNTSNVTTTFSVIAGSLPLGLVLSGPTDEPTYSYPSIYGTTSTNCNTALFIFTIRATDINGNIADRGFSINVLDIEPSYLFPASNLGTFPDGQWLWTSVAPISATPNWPVDMQVVSGNLPSGLTLDPISGNITGYPDPSILFNSGFVFINKESGKPLLANSAISQLFAFTVQYDANNSANYSIIVERQDLFNNPNANIAGPCYHDPIFTSATYTAAMCSTPQPSLNIGLIDGESLYYQIQTLDFEDNTIGYILINGNVVPGNLTINSQTGWISGFVDRDLSQPTPYTFQVLAYKSASVFANAYEALATCTVTIQNPLDNSLVWLSPSNLGNLYAGFPSNIAINASIVYPFTTPPVISATANCTLKLVSVGIINGGNAFANGSIFTLPGGIYANSANIIVSNISSSGTITNVTIDQAVIQQYTELPPSNTIIWINETGNSNALNAIFSLSFGVDEITVLEVGDFYDTATVGFSDAGQANSATGTAYIYNGTISNVAVDKTGDGYKAVPQVIINGKKLISPTNPIKYSLTSGAIPAGCELLSNGLIVGLPSAQYYYLNNSNVNTFSFTVTAAIGQNRSINFTETDLAGNNVVTQDFQTLITSDKTFSLNLISSASAPRTNLSLEFLLSEADLQTFYTPLLDQTIVPNDSIYRQDDFYFGIAPHVRMLLAYGISPNLPDNVQNVMAQYFHNNTYTFNDIQWAQSTTEGYEVLYIQPYDEFTNSYGQTFSGDITYNTPSGVMTAYPATLTNMIKQLNTNLDGFDYNYLPAWMRDVQPNGQILGYIPAIPLVYVKSGTGRKIQYYLQSYYSNIGPSLSSINAICDRLIWNTGFSENWDCRPRVTVLAKNIFAEFTGVSKSGTNAIYSVFNVNGNSRAIVPVSTVMSIRGMSNIPNNGLFTVTSSNIGNMVVTNANVITETNSGGYGYSLNLGANTSFIINPASPLTFTPNLTPRTYQFDGNITITLPSNITDINTVSDTINSLYINGIHAGIDGNCALYITNTYGCPFILYDGVGTPLANLGILPSSNISANINIVIVAGWWNTEFLSFDQLAVANAITTETDIILTTENCIVIITEGAIDAATTFIDIPNFMDTADIFLNDDDGAVYLKFANSYFINQPVVTV